MHAVELAQVLGAAFECVDAGGVDAGVAKQVGEAQEVFFRCVEGAGKEMAQVVWKDFFRCDASLPAESFHGAPDVRTVNRASGSCCKDRTSALFLLAEVAFEQGTEF